MKPLIAGLLLSAALAASGCAPLGMSADVRLRSAAPPPQFEFQGEPQFSYLPDPGVYVIDDDSFGYDMFASGGFYFVYDSGNWYRSRNVHGPYAAVEVSRVPQRIFQVSDDQYRWRSHPEGWHGRQRRGDRDDQRTWNGRRGGDDRDGNH